MYYQVDHDIFLNPIRETYNASITNIKFKHFLGFFFSSAHSEMRGFYVDVSMLLSPPVIWRFFSFILSALWKCASYPAKRRGKGLLPGFFVVCAVSCTIRTSRT